MKLKLEHFEKLSPELFEKHPVWAEYYEPDDENRMIADGFDWDEVRRELERIEYSDSFLIPYLNFERPSPYEFTLYKASVIVNGTRELFATLFVVENTVNSVTIFVGCEQFVINLTDSDFSDESELCKALGVKSVYPLTVQSDKGIEFNEHFDAAT